MSKVLRRDEVTAECRWQPPALEELAPAEPIVEEMVDPSALAQVMLQQAEAEATNLVANAQVEADAIRQQAQEEGYRAGQAQAALEAEEREKAYRALVEEIEQERVAFFERSEPELIRLAVAIAEKVLAQQLEVKPETVVDLTRTHIKRIRERETLTLRVNPEDLPLLTEARKSFLSEIDGIREIQLQEDRRVGAGGVILEAPSGTFDARFSTQLNVIREALDDTLEGTGEPAED